jgi:branched-chain amino acid transport system permease protein
MDFSIAAILAQDGITSGAIYALLALALVLVFSVTRIIFIPQGEFVAFGALSLAAIQSGQFPHSASLLLSLGVLCLLKEIYQSLRAPQRSANLLRALFPDTVKLLLLPLLLWLLMRYLPLQELPMLVQVVLALLLVIPMGPMMYRLAYQPLAEASTLVLLIVSVGLHLALTGLGLVMFGAEGSRTAAFSDAQLARFSDDLRPESGRDYRFCHADDRFVCLF